MPARLSYAVPIARQLLRSTTRRLRPGGLSTLLPAPQERPFVIVTGAGRSGTSAVARVLHESGVAMGNEFDAPSEFNAAGFYEDIEVRSINELIMGDVGLLQIEGSHAWPWRSAVLAAAARYEGDMEELASRAADGWKDPRFCATLEAWLPHLPRRPRVVVCLRSPEAFLHSVVRMVGLVDREALERWWANELRRLLDVIRDYRLEATCVEYDELVQHPEETVAALSAFLGAQLDASYVGSELRHFTYPVPRRYVALYQRMRALNPRASAARPDEEPSVGHYLERVGQIESRVGAAEADWYAGVGTPQPKLAREAELGVDRARVLEETRSASEGYVAVLSEAQRELGSLVPPDAFEGYHELLREFVDRSRLVAHLLLETIDGSALRRRSLDEALRAWELFAAPDAVAKARKRRQREYARALRASGHLPSRRAAAPR